MSSTNSRENPSFLMFLGSGFFRSATTGGNQEANNGGTFEAKKLSVAFSDKKSIYTSFFMSPGLIVLKWNYTQSSYFLIPKVSSSLIRCGLHTRPGSNSGGLGDMPRIGSKDLLSPYF